MLIYRFIDDSDRVVFGTDPREGQAELLEGPGLGSLQPAGRRAAVRKMLAPLDPTNIYCIGLNYAKHAQEGGQSLPDYPVIFMKPTTATQNPGDPIVLPACCNRGAEVDYECELAVVIGLPGRNISPETAGQHILGYTCANDVSARRWQKHAGGGQWVRGKSFDTFCPLGPCIATVDEVPDPQSLSIRTELNGQTMQQSNTSDMIFSVAQVVSFISQDTTLVPGTVILTGTPQGVGFARKPPVFLKAGDEVVIEIERIGRLSNPVAEAS
jgi:2-keto-4-pentenoate hydratase/2-oxohepta-3-ene-1,7-dioic acid hydratase in catechol pathway